MHSALTGIKACVFDAYGTLFDVHSAVGRYQQALGENADALSALWRNRQLEYTWLRSLMKAYVPFSTLTEEALQFAMQTYGVEDEALASNLMQAYMTLDAYPEVPAVLQALKAQGKPCAILTNGSPQMIAAAVDSAGLGSLLDHCLSVDPLQIYKPDPSVYQLAVDALGVAPEEILFHSSNAWDAAGAAYFGFRVVWINRFGQQRERLPGEPLVVLDTLETLPSLLA